MMALIWLRQPDRNSRPARDMKIKDAYAGCMINNSLSVDFYCPMPIMGVSTTPGRVTRRLRGYGPSIDPGPYN